MRKKKKWSYFYECPVLFWSKCKLTNITSVIKAKFYLGTEFLRQMLKLFFHGKIRCNSIKGNYLLLEFLVGYLRNFRSISLFLRPGQGFKLYFSHWSKRAGQKVGPDVPRYNNVQNKTSGVYFKTYLIILNIQKVTIKHI